MIAPVLREGAEERARWPTATPCRERPPANGAGLTLPELARIIELAKDFDASFEWLASDRGQVQLAVAEKSPAYRRLTDYESHLLDAFRNLPEPKRRLLVEFLS